MKNDLICNFKGINVINQLIQFAQYMYVYSDKTTCRHIVLDMKVYDNTMCGPEPRSDPQGVQGSWTPKSF